MNKALLDICIKDLFLSAEELNGKYSPDTVSSILRVRDMYLWILKFPHAKDAEFVKEEVGRYRVSRPTAYADLNLIKALLPDLSKSSKEFQVWQFTQMVLETYRIALAKKDVRTMERAAATFARYLGLDKEKEEKLPLDKIIVQPIVPTDDPSVLGFKPIPNRRQLIESIIKKYSADVPDIMDIGYEEADVILPEGYAENGIINDSDS